MCVVVFNPFATAAILVKWLNCNYNVALEDSLMSHGKLGKTFYLNTIMLKYHIFSISVLEKLLPRPLE